MTTPKYVNPPKNSERLLMEMQQWVIDGATPEAVLSRVVASPTSKFAVVLNAVGNPDHGQNPDEEPFGCEPSHVEFAETIEQAQEWVRAFIERNNLGGGNFPDAVVFRAPSKGEAGWALCGEIYYNGRFVAAVGGSSRAQTAQPIDARVEQQTPRAAERPVRLRLIVEVEYALADGESASALASQLDRLVASAASRGDLTGAWESEVAKWSAKVEEKTEAGWRKLGETETQDYSAPAVKAGPKIG